MNEQLRAKSLCDQLWGPFTHDTFDTFSIRCITRLKISTWLHERFHLIMNLFVNIVAAFNESHYNSLTSADWYVNSFHFLSCPFGQIFHWIDYYGSPLDKLNNKSPVVRRITVAVVVFPLLLQIIITIIQAMIEKKTGVNIIQYNAISENNPRQCVSYLQLVHLSSYRSGYNSTHFFLIVRFNKC